METKIIPAGRQVKILRELELLDPPNEPIGSYVTVEEYLPNYDLYIITLKRGLRATIESKFIDDDPQMNLNV